jgi:S-formylglutathione hydrolase FrmB
MPIHNFDALGGRVVEIEIDSAALRGNLLGDPSKRRVAVHLPPGYDQSDERYPLFVDLAGFTGSGLKRLSWTAFGESVPQRLERLVAQDSMGPVITAFPDGFTSLGGNQYVDSPATGYWERFIIDEMLPALEDRFRIRRGRKHRAIYGKSSGGYGALVHGLRHADTWAAVACHSGDMAFEWVYLREFPGTLDALARHEGKIERFVEAFRAAPKVRGPDLHAMMILAMAATYDPDPGAPLGIRLPVDPLTCEVVAERWERWLAHDPVRLVERADCQDNLRRLSALYLDCGRHDQYFLHYGARAFVRRLEALEIAHRYEEFPDNHSSVDYRLDVSLPILYEAVAG